MMLILVPTQIHAHFCSLKLYCSEPPIHSCLGIGGVIKMMGCVLI